MDIITHQAIDPDLCGRPVEVKDGYSHVQLETSQAMAEKGIYCYDD